MSRQPSPWAKALWLGLIYIQSPQPRWWFLKLYEGFDALHGSLNHCYIIDENANVDANCERSTKHQPCTITKQITSEKKKMTSHPFKTMCRTMEFFLNVLTEFSDKNYLSLKWLLYKRPICYHSPSKTPVRDRIFKFSPLHASVIYQIPWIHWIQWKLCSI